MKRRIISCASFIAAITAFAVLPARAVTISMSLPGSTLNSSSTPPGAFVESFYQFALMIGGVLAFGIIVFGGVKYMTAAGNPSRQGDAKDWIQSALLGLLLLAGAYFILNVVNPQLTNLTLPSPIPLTTTSGNGSGNGSSDGSGTGATNGNGGCVFVGNTPIPGTTTKTSHFNCPTNP